MIRIIFIDNLVCLKAFVFICVTPVFGLVLHYIMKNIGSPMDKLIQNGNLNIFGQAGWKTIPDYQAFLVKQAFFINLLFSCYLYFFIAWKTTVYCWKYREDFATLYMYLFVYFVLLHLYLVYCWKYKLVPGQRVGCNPVHASRREYRATHLNKGNMYINVRNSKHKYRWKSSLK